MPGYRADRAARQHRIPDDHDYNEIETRDAFVDLLLQEAGWSLDQAREREFPVTGMPNEQGQGYVDYVLWGDDGRPLAIIEVKRSIRRVDDAFELDFLRKVLLVMATGAGKTRTVIALIDQLYCAKRSK
ncbi:DEAD/DEAH box helicase family protein [uncultured Lamprocystis sp.]|jgi:type I site-specific restriction endonuclease|uniref:DEAD/DEAH box helicase family protein n=1 Tax=uncultured Lamprocystis sp. TaxID=543132 RepID=UPI0025EF5ADC|nr:DEAD/DEAH box helicase family protein [uncultured Lamprocystis sp.]